MGTDIHMIVQQRSTEPSLTQIEGDPNRPVEGVIVGSESDVSTRTDTVWNTVELPGYVLHALTARNYSAFSILAGVRGDLPAISEPRGLPEDLAIVESQYGPSVYAPSQSSVTAEDVAKYPDDYTDSDIDTYSLGEHSFSWLTLRELVAYPWAALVTKTGYVGHADFKHWDGSQYLEDGSLYVNDYFPRQRMESPGSWCGMVAGGGVQIVSEEELRRTKPDPGESGYFSRKYAFCTWEVPITRAAGDLFTVAMPWLATVAKGDLDSIRLVFGFDS